MTAGSAVAVVDAVVKRSRYGSMLAVARSSGSRKGVDCAESASGSDLSRESVAKGGRKSGDILPP